MPDLNVILIHLMQYNTDKSGLKKKTYDADKKIADTSGLVTKTDNNQGRIQD